MQKPLIICENLVKIYKVADLEVVALPTSAIIGLPSETHHESILIDRVGRLQLPKEAIDSIPFNGRAEVRIARDHVELWPINTNINGNQNGEVPPSLNQKLR
jgi:hypothetical protein